MVVFLVDRHELHSGDRRRRDDQGTIRAVGGRARPPPVDQEVEPLHDGGLRAGRLAVGASGAEAPCESTCVRLTSPAPPPNSLVERVASVSVSVVNFTRDPPTKTSLPRVEIELDRAGSNRGFLWGAVGVAGPARLEIEIKFINFKILNGPPLTSSQISYQRTTVCHTAARSGLSRMLSEGVLTDIVVNAVGGSIGTHRAVLAARSPVFEKMFSHDLREKTESTLHIRDMSAGACRAFLGYLYGDLRGEDFLAHRGELLHAGDKYDVAELVSACEDSMMDGVDVENALEMLRTANLYGLPALKRYCVRFLRERRIKLS